MAGDDSRGSWWSTPEQEEDGYTLYTQAQRGSGIQPRTPFAKREQAGGFPKNGRDQTVQELGQGSGFESHGAEISGGSRRRHDGPKLLKSRVQNRERLAR